MSKHASPWWLGWSICGMVLLLCLLLAWLWLGSRSWGRWQPPEAIATDIQTLLPPLENAGRTPPDADHAGLLQRLHERPLFILTRRPQDVTAEAEPTEEAQDAWAQARLLGTFAGGPQGPGAIILYEDQTRRLLQGQSLGGWTLQQVEERAVSLERAGAQQRLELQKADVGSLAAAMPAAQPEPAPPPRRTDTMRFMQEPPRRRR